MLTFARVVQFVVVFVLSGSLLAFAARYCFAELDTLPDEEPVTVTLFSHFIPAEMLVGITVWVLALLIAINHAHSDLKRQKNLSKGAMH